MDKVSEVEIKTVLPQWEAESLFNKILDLKVLPNGLEIERIVKFSLKDRYYDTRDLSIWSKRAYLRWREYVGEERKVMTYRKEISGIYGGRLEARSEGLSQAEKVFSELSGDIPGIKPDLKLVDEVEMMKSGGLVPLTSFQTDRILMRVPVLDFGEPVNVKFDKTLFSGGELYYFVELNVFSSKAVSGAKRVFDAVNQLSGGKLIITSEYKMELALYLEKITY